MKILITVDPEIPVPPRGYGGIERVVDLLIDQLIRKGHDVTLLAHPESRTQATLRPWKGLRSQNLHDLIQNMLHVRKVLREGQSHDVIHSFARLAYLAPILSSSIPKIQTYERRVTPRSVRWGSRLAGSSLTFTACSQALVDSARCGKERWEAIHNGIRLEKYRFVAHVAPDAPLVFLGRFDPEKGAHHAIAAARRAGRKLVLAGRLPQDTKSRDYFEKEIVTQVNGDEIRCVGELDDAAKNDLLGGAAALLFPVEWEEPFGIVMAEALACGTPVIAFGRGSIPEVIRHGKTGWIGRDVNDLVEGVSCLNQLDRKACRTEAEQRFSAEYIAEKYIALYENVRRRQV